MEASSSWDDDEPFTEEQLLAIDAIEASYHSPSSPSSSYSYSPSPCTPTVRTASPGHGLTDRNQIPQIRSRRRRLPRSVTSPSAPLRRYPLSRCQAGFRRFPVMRFGGKILYCRTASEVDRAAMQLLKIVETKREETGRAVIGFDIEWKPSFKRGVLPGKVAVIQICVDNNFCHVMHIIHSGIPQSLQYLIEDSTLTKVGIGIDGDSVKLFHDYGVSIQDVEDLSELANKKLSGSSKKWSLASLTETLVCKELLKPSKIRLGNWEANVLAKEQLQYAATDAFASWHIYQVLKDLPNADQCTPDEKSDESRDVLT